MSPSITFSITSSIVLRLTLFGGVGVWGPEGPLGGRAFHRRRLALLSLLGAVPSGVVSRDKLIGYLWPESDAEQARHLLAVSLYELRKALGEEVIASRGDDVQLVADLMQSDVQEFGAAIAAGDLARAAALYTGPFLDGFFVSRAPEFERWSEVERDRLARAWVEVLHRLAAEARERGDWAETIAILRRLAAQDPYNARTALALMDALGSSGDRAGAIQHARIHETLLREEFGVEPDAAITGMVERLRREPPPATTPPPLPPPVPPASAGPGVAAEEDPRELVPATIDAAPAGPAASPFDDGRNPARAGARVWWGTRALVGGALALLLCAAIWIGLARWGGPEEPGGTPARIAVLPLEDLSGEDYRYLSDGITEELINSLAQVPQLRVSARTSSFAYRGRQVDVREIGRELGVESIVEGSIRKEGDRLDLNVRLVDVSEGYHLWARSYDRAISEVFAIQDEIAREVVRALLPRSGGKVRGTDGSARTSNIEAYHLYLKGRYLWNHRDRTEGRAVNLRKSIDYYRRALAADPRYALAYAGLADSYASLAGIVPPAEAYRSAKKAALEALRLDGSLAEAHTALGRILVFDEWNWKAAEREYRRAVELSPSNAVGRHWYGMYLLHQGRTDAAIAELRVAQGLDPLSLSIGTDLARALYYARRYDEAVAHFHSVLELEPRLADAALYLGLTYAEQGKLEESLREFRRWGALTGGSSKGLTAYALAAAGRRAEAMDSVRELESGEGARGVSPVSIGLIHARLGHRDEAFRWLERSFAQRSSFFLFLKVTPRVDSLRADPRFDRLLRQTGLPPES